MEKYFVAVAGNMGVGKSTLVRKLAQKLNWQVLLEPDVENPYLADFYAMKPRWAFNSQAFYLGRRIEQCLAIEASPSRIVQDRCIYEDAEVFARNLYERGDLPERDWETYQSLYRPIVSLLPKPNLLIYLDANLETLKERIAIRDKEFERRLDEKYLADLQKSYVRWIAGYQISPVLTVPADWLDFVKKEEDFDQIVEKMFEKLSGHETLSFNPPV